MKQKGNAIFKVIFVVAILAVVTFIFYKPGEKKLDNTLVYCSEDSPEGFNPQLFTTGTTFDASSRQVYNRLFEFEIGKTNVLPGLAERYTVSKDGKVYTFYLRRDVQFHKTDFFTPTRPFNADDVIFSINRQFDKNNPYHLVSGGSYQYFNDMGMGKLIQSVKKIDDYTVQVELKNVESPFISNLAMDFSSILSKEYADQMLAAGTPEKVDLRPIGTGPFKFKSYKKDAFIRYTAHEGYWRGKENIDKLIFAITADPAVRLAKLKSGECHVMAYPLPSQLDTIKDHTDLTLDQQPGLNIGYWAFNTRKPPMDNLLVRKALVHAIDKQAIINAVFNGKAQVAKNFIPPTIWSYNDTVKDHPYDPEKAKTLLSEAGYGDGFKIDLWAMPVQRPYNPNASKMAEIMKENLKAVGIEADIVSYDWGTYIQKITAGEHQTVLIGWTGDNGDPDNFFSPLLSCNAADAGSNYSFWCFEPFDTLITQARQTADINQRTELYQQAQVIFKEQVPNLTIAHSKRFQPRRKEVQGLKIDPFGGIYFSGVSIAQSK